MKIEYLADNQWAIPIVAKHVYDNMILNRDDEHFETMIAKYKRLANKGSLPFVLIAFEEIGNVTGTVSVLVNDNMPVKPNAPPWIAALYVDQAYRKQGIATRLISTAIEEIKKLGIKKDIYLFTSDGFRINFYEKYGFKKTKNLIYKGINKVEMLYKMS